MAYYLSPIFQDAQLATSTGIPLVGGKLYTYLAGSSTPATVYQDDGGGASHANPIVLNARGEPSAPIWIVAGQSIKFALYDASNSLIRTVDDVTGVNDPTSISTSTPTEWVSLSLVPTYISSTSFSVPGNQSSTLHVGRRVKIPVSGNTSYGWITASTPSGSPPSNITTITVDTTNSAGLDSSISSLTSFEYALLSGDNPSVPAAARVWARTDVRIGTSTSEQTLITASADTRTSSTSSYPQTTYTNTTNDGTYGSSTYYKNRAAGNTAVNDVFWVASYGGYANSAQRVAAQMVTVQDGAVSGSTVPGAFVWSTQAAGGSLNENLRVDSTGCIRIAGQAAATGYTTRGDVTLPAARAVRAKNTLKAWVVFDGTPTGAYPITLTITAGFGVDNITKNAVGDYTVNFTAGVMSDANYCPIAMTGDSASSNIRIASGPRGAAPTASAFRLTVSDTGPTLRDTALIYVMVAGN